MTTDPHEHDDRDVSGLVIASVEVYVDGQQVYKKAVHTDSMAELKYDLDEALYYYDEAK